MPVPTNTDITTATTLFVPSTVIQDVNFGGTTYSVWYAFTATQTGVVGLWAYGHIGVGAGTYQARLRVYLGPADDPTQYPPDVNMTSVNVPVQFPVTSGITYYLEVVSTDGNVATASLTLTAEYFVNASAPAGTLVIPDDAPDLPWALLSPTTGEVVQFKVDEAPPGEAGVSEPSIGAVLVDDNRSTERKFKLYTSTLSYVTSLAHASAHGGSGSPDLGVSFGRTNHCFYAGWISTGTTMLLKRLSPSDLTIQASWTLAGVTNIRAFAPNPAETVLYLSGKAGTTGSAISKYDLVTPGFLADFAATIANYIATEILTLSDGTVVVLYQKTTATKDLLLKTYNSSGVVLQSKSYGSAIATASVSRMTYALDAPTSFIVWIHNDDGTDTIKRVLASDLSDVTTATTPVYEEGVYQPNQTATPLPWGHSQSCPIFVLRASAPLITTITVPVGEGTTVYPDCATETPQTFTITGTGFPVSPIVTVTSPSSVVTHPTVLSSTSTQVIVSVPMVLCGTWTFSVSGSDAFAVRTARRDPMRRMRIFALPFNENKRLFLRRLELFLEQGQGLITDSAAPQIMVSISDDGGFTWGHEEWVAAGEQGNYTKQSIINNLGSYRNGALKIVVSDPVAWHLVAAFADIEQGSS